MTNLASQPLDESATGPVAGIRLAPGTVLAGRWVVRDTGTSIGPGRLHEATDRRLGSRPCALVAWPDVAADALTAAWPAATASHAPLVDVIDIAGGAVAVLALHEGSDRVMNRASMSREARARLAVELVSAVRRAETRPCPITQMHPTQLWCSADSDAPRLVLVPVPRLDRVGSALEAHHGEERAELVRRVASWLYGLEASTMPEDARKRLPDGVRASLGALYSSDCTERMAARLDPDEIARALGVLDGVSVPVPTGELGGAGIGATWASRVRSVGRRGWRQVAFVCGVIGVLAGSLAPLLGGAEHPAVMMQSHSYGTEDAVTTPSPVIPSTPPAPVDLTPRAQAYRELSSTPTWFASVGEGPLPSGVTAVDAAFLAGLRGSHAVFTNDDGAVRRVEDYGPFGRFDGWREVERTEDGNAATVRFFDTTSRLLRVRHVDFAAGRITERLPDGATALGDCDALSVVFDARRRPVEERCLDRDGRRIPFADGPEVIRQQWDDQTHLPVRIEYFDADGAPIANRDGVAAENVTWDAFGRESVRSFERLDGQPVRHQGIGAAQVVTTWRIGGVRTSLFDELQRPIRGPDGWHAEDVSWHDDRSVRRAWLDEARGPVPIRGTAVAVEAMVVDDHGALIERRWLGVDGQPVTDGPAGTVDGAHRYTYVPTEHDDVLRACAWGLDDSAVSAPVFEGAHCQYMQRDALGRVIAEWRIDVSTDTMPDRETGADRTVWTWSSEGVVTRVSWHRADGAPMQSQGGGVALRYVLHPTTGDRLRQVWVDDAGRPVVRAEGHSEITWRYDARGRVVERCQVRGRIGDDAAKRVDLQQCVSTLYDDAGRVQRLSWGIERPIAPTWPDEASSSVVDSVEFVYLGGEVVQQVWVHPDREPSVLLCGTDVCVHGNGDGPLSSR